MHENDWLIDEHLELAEWIALGFLNIPGLHRDEIRSEAQFALLRAARTYKSDKGPFEPYAKTVIRNALRNLFHKEKRRAHFEQENLNQPQFSDSPSGAGEPQEQADSNADPVVQARIAETRRILDKLLGSYDKDTRTLIELRAQGFSFTEIGMKLGGVSDETIRQRFEKTRKEMKARLNELGFRRLDSLGLLLFEKLETLFEDPDSSPT